jgi:hypothetical protein
MAQRLCNRRSAYCGRDEHPESQRSTRSIFHCGSNVRLGECVFRNRVSSTDPFMPLGAKCSDGATRQCAEANSPLQPRTALAETAASAALPFPRNREFDRDGNSSHTLSIGNRASAHLRTIRKLLISRHDIFPPPASSGIDVLISSKAVSHEVF